jgi:hypothetical protein
MKSDKWYSWQLGYMKNSLGGNYTSGQLVYMTTYLTIVQLDIWPTWQLAYLTMRKMKTVLPGNLPPCK